MEHITGEMSDMQEILQPYRPSYNKARAKRQKKERVSARYRQVIVDQVEMLRRTLCDRMMKDRLFDRYIKSVAQPGNCYTYCYLGIYALVPDVMHGKVFLRMYIPINYYPWIVVPKSWPVSIGFQSAGGSGVPLEAISWDDLDRVEEELAKMQALFEGPLTEIYSYFFRLDGAVPAWFIEAVDAAKAEAAAKAKK